MIAALRARIAAAGDGEAGMTLMELLVAATLSVLVFGGVVTMLISAVRTQPQVSERSESVQTARWALERMTREIRNGLSVAPGATGSRVSFLGQVRRQECGGTAALASGKSARACQITYDCSQGAGTDGQGRPRYACTRTEAEEGVLVGGVTRTLVSGLGSANVFSFTPNPEEAAYIGVTLRIPNASGPSGLEISDGASLRTMTILAG